MRRSTKVCAPTKMICRNFLGISYISNAAISAHFLDPSMKLNKIQLRYHSASSNHSTPSEPRAAALHAKAIKDGSARNLHVGNCLLTYYAERNRLGTALKLFDEIPSRDVRSWTIIVSSLARSGFCENALGLFVKMLKEGIVVPNKFTLFSVFKCCSSVNDGLRTGKALHGWIVTCGMDSDTALENAVLDFYVKHEAFDCAERFFRLMGSKNAGSWNIMLAGYLRMGDLESCIEFFRRMDVKDVSSWNTIMSGLLLSGFERDALEFLYEMSKNGPAFNKVTFSVSLKLVSSLVSFELGRQIHGKLMRDAKFRDASLRTSLMDMYCKCRQMEKASGFLKI